MSILRKDIVVPADPVVPNIPSWPSDPNVTTPGYQTSEFWITLVSAIVPNLITILAVMKLVPTEVASTLSTSLVAVIGGIITIFVTLKYVKSRTDVKIKAIEIESKNYYSKAALTVQLFEKGLIEKSSMKKMFKIG